MSTVQYPTHQFTYQYLAGPVVTEAELNPIPSVGNCRFALQLYFYHVHGLFLACDDIYLPGGYKVLGRFIFEETVIDYNQLQAGDIIYAQNLCNKRGEPIERDRQHYKTKDEWIFDFHSAIWIGEVAGESEPIIWHATSAANGPALWPLSKFLHHYLPISVKRII